MAFTLTIETGNAAFTGHPGDEIARILRHVADSLDIPLRDDERQPVRDYNGNTVGRWEYTPEYLQWECPRCHSINQEEDSQPGEMTCVDCRNTFTADEVTA